MRRLTLLATLLFGLAAFVACDTFVEDIDGPRDSAGYDQFTDDSEARFLLRGVQAQWADAHANVTAAADYLSDQFRFGLNGDATFPTFGQLDRGRPQLQNNSVDAAINDVGEYRFLADDLLDRADEIDFGEETTASETELRYVAHLHGAIARYYYATYMGLNPRDGGGVIDESEFIPSPQMYQRAEDKFATALDVASQLGEGAFVSSSRAQKIVQSVRARAALFAGTHDFDVDGGFQGTEALEAAAEYTAEGLEVGDEAFDVPYTTQDPNDYANEAGRERVQMVAQDGVLLNATVSEENAYRRDEDGNLLVRSFPLDVILPNPKELARVPLVGITGGPAFTGDMTPDNAGEVIQEQWLAPLLDPEADLILLEFAQDRYAEDSPISFMSWQENHLMRAELELRGYDTGDETALELANEVRASYENPRTSYLPDGVQFADLSSVDLDRLAIERDRTLFAQGMRLPDQRRLDVPSAEWHLNETVEGGTTWQWLPITRQELDNNPNL